MNREDRHAISTAWIEALDWYHFYKVCCQEEQAAYWAQRAAELKQQLFPEVSNARSH